MKSRNLIIKDLLSSKTGTTDITNYYTKTSFSHIKSLSENSLYPKKEKRENSKKRNFNISSKDIKTLDRFLLTNIPSYYSKTERKKDKKEYLKIEKELGYKKYNNYHVPILNIIKKHNNLLKKRSTDIRHYKIKIPKDYELSSGQNTERGHFKNFEKKKKKRFYIGHLKEENNDIINFNFDDKNNSLLKDNKRNSSKNKNSIKVPFNRFSLISPKLSSIIKFPRFRRSSVIILHNLNDEKKKNIENIMLKNINHMKELEKKKELKEKIKNEKISKEVYSMLIKEFSPVENIMKKHFERNKKDIFKQNNIFFHDNIFISTMKNYSRKYQFKYQYENFPKEEKDFIKIPKMSISDIIEIECLKDEIKERSKSE